MVDDEALKTYNKAKLGILYNLLIFFICTVCLLNTRNAVDQFSLRLLNTILRGDS